MGLLIKNGEIITADSRYKADIFCENEIITQIGENLDIPEGTEIIDAGGKFVFPGFIDPHVHIYLPFMGTFSKDTHTTASQAALAGGTTTFIEMCVPSKFDDALESYELWKKKAEGNTACDYSFHMAVSRFDKKTEKQLRTIVADGITSFKVFLAYKGFFGVEDEELFKTLTLAKELGVLITAHCENAELVAQLQAQLLSEGKTGVEWHEPSRPVTVETDGVNHFASFLETTGAKGYIVHLSNRMSLNAAMRAKARGVDLTVEVVIPHLLLDKTYSERKNFEGAKFIMSPPLRERSNLETLWNALSKGFIDTVATDHAPFDFAGQKDMGRDDFTKIPNGIPAIEDRVTMLYTYGVSRGDLDIHRFVDVAATNAAKLFDMFPQKGTIAVGSDADLVVFDPEYRGVLRVEDQTMNLDYRGFEGFEIDGRPDIVTVRGKIAVKNGKFMGDPGRGKFIRRKSSK